MDSQKCGCMPPYTQATMKSLKEPSPEMRPRTQATMKSPKERIIPMRPPHYALRVAGFTSQATKWFLVHCVEGGGGGSVSSVVTGRFQS